MLKLRMDDPNEGFRIEQTIDGDTFVANLRLFINDHYIELLSPLNSREINPLYAAFESEIYQMFDDDGNFDSEFYKLWRDVGIKDE